MYSANNAPRQGQNYSLERRLSDGSHPPKRHKENLLPEHTPGAACPGDQPIDSRQITRQCDGKQWQTLTARPFEAKLTPDDFVPLIDLLIHHENDLGDLGDFGYLFDNWLLIGLYLGISINDLYNIHAQQPGNDGRFIFTLNIWLTQEEHQPSMERLCRGLYSEAGTNDKRLCSKITSLYGFTDWTYNEPAIPFSLQNLNLDSTLFITHLPALYQLCFSIRAEYRRLFDELNLTQYDYHSLANITHEPNLSHYMIDTLYRFLMNTPENKRNLRVFLDAIASGLGDYVLALTVGKTFDADYIPPKKREVPGETVSLAIAYGARHQREREPFIPFLQRAERLQRLEETIHQQVKEIPTRQPEKQRFEYEKQAPADQLSEATTADPARWCTIL